MRFLPKHVMCAWEYVDNGLAGDEVTSIWGTARDE